MLFFQNTLILFVIIKKKMNACDVGTDLQHVTTCKTRIMT